MAGKDDRLLVVIGPCSIHDPGAAVEYARKLKEARAKYRDTLEIVMRVYFEKPRTTVGWKGLINDPYLDESYRIDEGLRIARQLLIEINRLGLPAGSEFLDVISPQYIGDLISWGAIGARTTESQVHRELASGLSAPIGFKNGTDGNIKIATDAIQAAARPHHFLSVHKNGQVAIVQTNGNRDCHVILRGGKAPNYDAASVNAACKELEAAKLPCTLMVDCSHANSSKQHEKQLDVARDIAGQIASGSRNVFGVMVESHLVGGAQKFTPGRTSRRPWSTGKASLTPASAGTIRWKCWRSWRRPCETPHPLKVCPAECLHSVTSPVYSFRLGREPEEGTMTIEVHCAWGWRGIRGAAETGIRAAAAAGSLRARWGWARSPTPMPGGWKAAAPCCCPTSTCACSRPWPAAVRSSSRWPTSTAGGLLPAIAAPGFKPAVTFPLATRTRRPRAAPVRRLDDEECCRSSRWRPASPTTSRAWAPAPGKCCAAATCWPSWTSSWAPA